MNKTLMNEMKKLDNSELNNVVVFARELMVMNGKMLFKPGTKVFMVQKTKKKPGTVRKVLQKNAVVDMDDGRTYRVRSSLTLDTTPWSVCRVSSTEVAVCLRNDKTIQFVSVSDKLVPTRSLSMKHECSCITVIRDKMYVCACNLMWMFTQMDSGVRTE